MAHSEYKNDMLDGLGFEEVTPGRWGKKVRFREYVIDVYIEPEYLMADEMIDHAFTDVMFWAYKTAWELRSGQVRRIREEMEK